MMRGRIEREIRLLPQVLSCSLNDDEVVVLVAPSGDPRIVEEAVAELLVSENMDLGVRVIGGRPAVRPALAGRPWRSPGVLVGSVAATGLLALSSLVGGLGSRDRGPTRRPPVIAGPEPSDPLVPTPPGTPLPTGTPSPTPQPSAEQTGAPIDPRIDPERVTRSRSGSRGPSGPSSSPRPAPVPRPTPVPTPRPTPTQPSSHRCHEPAARHAPRPYNGNGHGPPTWSHSVHNDPHCHRGRPR